MLGAKQKRIQY